MTNSQHTWYGVQRKTHQGNTSISIWELTIKEIDSMMGDQVTVRDSTNSDTQDTLTHELMLKYLSGDPACADIMVCVDEMENQTELISDDDYDAKGSMLLVEYLLVAGNGDDRRDEKKPIC